LQLQCLTNIFYLAQLQFLNGVYNGIGRSTGALVGGWLQAELGTVRTFMYSAILNVVLAMLLFAYTSLREVSGVAKQFQKNTEDKKRL
jgi:predicted MFS family arabinose efflux permease